MTMPCPPAAPDESDDALRRGSLLSPSVRRDIADLNRQFLDLALAPELADDPRFAWSQPVREVLRETDEPTRCRMAASPFTFFELRLPPAEPRAAAEAGRVEDTGLGSAASVAAGRCASFLHFALFVAWRLADVAPLATRIVLGLPPAAELRLNEMRPSQLLQLAAWPDLIRPRWACDLNFWAMLARASRGNSAIAMQSAHCIGICRLDSVPATGAGPPRGDAGPGRRERR
jgi:hypothetical protein